MMYNNSESQNKFILRGSCFWVPVEYLFILCILHTVILCMLVSDRKRLLGHVLLALVASRHQPPLSMWRTRWGQGSCSMLLTSLLLGRHSDSYLVVGGQSARKTHMVCPMHKTPPNELPHPPQSLRPPPAALHSTTCSMMLIRWPLVWSRY